MFMILYWKGNVEGQGENKATQMTFPCFLQIYNDLFKTPFSSKKIFIMNANYC